MARQTEGEVEGPATPAAAIKLFPFVTRFARVVDFARVVHAGCVCVRSYRSIYSVWLCLILGIREWSRDNALGSILNVLEILLTRVDLPSLSVGRTLWGLHIGSP